MRDPKAFANLLFSEAEKQYCDSRSDLRPRSLKQLRQDCKQAAKFFGHLRLSQIHVGHFTEYQAARAENREGLWKRKAKASIINHELSAVQSILKRAEGLDGRTLWSKIEPWYKPLPTPPVQSAKVLSDEDDMLFFGVLSTEPRCRVAYWVASITENTGAAGKEIRTLRLMDVHLDARVPWIQVREEVSKNVYRTRVVVLNATAAKQLGRAVDRALAECGCKDPEDHVFPKRHKSQKRWLPKEPASESWLRKQWDYAREITGLKEVTPHMFRHMHITLSQEAGEPEPLIAKRVGHSKINMTRYYTHTRENSQSKAVNAVDPTVRFGPQVLRNARGKKTA